MKTPSQTVIYKVRKLFNHVCVLSSFFDKNRKTLYIDLV